MRFKPVKGGLALPVGAHDILNMETTIILISADKGKPENAIFEIHNWLESAIVTADELAQMILEVPQTLIASVTNEFHATVNRPEPSSERRMRARIVILIDTLQRNPVLRCAKEFDFLHGHREALYSARI